MKPVSIAISGTSRTTIIGAVHTSAQNSCYNRLKQKGVPGRNTDFDESIHSAAGPQTANPDTVLVLAERTELVKKSLAELPAKYREILVLRELEQLSYREIANIAAIPFGTVMSRLSRTRKQLQQDLLDSNSPFCTAVSGR